MVSPSIKHDRFKQERNMTRKSTKCLIAVASVLTVTGFAMVAQSGAANAKNVLSCDGGGRQSIVECCETIVLKKGLPMWMRQTGRNCATIGVICAGGNHDTSFAAAAVKRRCWVALAQTDRDSKDAQSKQRDGKDNRGSQDRASE
jgi:hypothetical protein